MDNNQLGKLIQLFQETSSFKKILQKYRNQSFSDYDRVKNHICILLIDEALQNHEILNALVILFDCDLNVDILKSAYLNTVLSIAEPRCHAIIMAFLIYLSQKKKDRSWLDVDSIDFYQEISRLPITPQDIEYIRRVNSIYQTEISTVITLENTTIPGGKNWDEVQLIDEIQAIASIEKELDSTKLQLNMMTLVPSVMEISDHELEYLFWEEEETLLWTPLRRYLSVSEDLFLILRTKSITNPLSPEETHEFLFAIKQTPTLLRKHPYTVEQTSQLVTHNWSLIIDLVVLLHSLAPPNLPPAVVTNGSKTKAWSNNNTSVAILSSEPATNPPNHTTNHGNTNSLLLLFLNAFLHMEITTQVLETFHAICKKVDLPIEFVQKYLLQCMDFCSKNKETRFVRLVCGLVQSILKKNPKPIVAIIVELQSFCLSFTNVKDAIVLYAMTKGMDSK